ncbi:MAG: hypothetical protein ACPLYF_03945 [Fervidobacterium sp.]
MRFAVISREGDGAGIALRLKEEGNDVAFWNAEKSANECITGFGIRRYFASSTSLTDFIAKHRDWYFIFDDFLWGSIQEKMRSHNIPVIGTNILGQRIETDRIFQMELAKRLGVRVPESYTLRSINDAINHIKLHPARYILKQTGDMPKTLNYAAQENDSSDLIAHLEAVSSRMRIPSGNFILQKYISGTEVAVTTFLTHSTPISMGGGPLCFVNFEHKKLLEGDRGLTTGEMGTGVIAEELTENTGNRIFSEMLYPLLPYLNNYYGAIDANCIIDKEKQIWLLEWTLRLPYPEIYIIISMLDEPLWTFFSRLISGNQICRFKLNQPHVGLVLGLPLYPIEDAKGWKDSFYNEKVDLKNLSGEDRRNLYLIDVKRVKQDLKIATNFGYVGVSVGSGETFTEASLRAQERLEKIPISKYGFYRRDIGQSSDARYRAVAGVLHEKESRASTHNAVPPLSY